MHLQYFEKDISYTDRERDFIEKKLRRLARYCSRLKDESSFIHIETEQRPTKKKRDMVKVMITMELPRKILRAESRRNHALEAIDRCIEKLEPQLLEYKEKRAQRGRLVARKNARNS